MMKVLSSRNIYQVKVGIEDIVLMGHGSGYLQHVIIVIRAIDLIGSHSGDS